MTIATWNVNSVRVRAPRLLAWLRRARPDIVCLQELKAVDALFPRLEVETEGYSAVVHGQPGYNGVAILSREVATSIETGLDDGSEPPQARVVAATVAGIRVVSAYVPNGQEVGSAKYEYKRRWLGIFREWLVRSGVPSVPTVVCGDLNLCPDERDVHDPSVWEGTVLFNPEMRQAFRDLLGVGLVDVLRRLHPQPGLFTFWDYQMLAFPRNLGLRIDHVLATPDLASRCSEVAIHRDERKGEKPSDHVPVVARFDP